MWYNVMADDDHEGESVVIAPAGSAVSVSVAAAEGCSAYVEQAHTAIQHVARSLPWMFIDPNINSSNTILIKQTQVEEDDDNHSSSTLSNSESNISSTDLDEDEERADANQQKEEESEFDDEEIIRHKLSLRTYHLEGNNWCDDWKMYIQNNHLVFGICCHHHLHPVKKCHRFILLLGSLAFGLIVTNLVYLFGDAFSDADEAVAKWADKIHNETDLITIESDMNIYIAGQSLSMGTTQIGILWTLGSGLHSFFDFALWHMIACGHCKKRHEIAGWTMAVFLVVMMVSIMTVMIYFRAFRSEEDGLEQDDPITDDASIAIDTALNFANAEPNFQFLYAYPIEVLLSLFVYTPLVQTIIFSGIVGCCWMPFLGGRPRALRTLKNEEKTTLAEF